MQSEVFSNADNKCKDLPNFPVATGGAVGALIQDYPLICGGANESGYTQECYIFQRGNWQVVGQLFMARRYAASLKMPNGSLWILGGEDGSQYLASTEILNLDDQGMITEHVYGPSLPQASEAHCAVEWNSQAILIGGDFGATTYFYDLAADAWDTPGPKLKYTGYRKWPACGTIMDTVTGKMYVSTL